MVEIFKEACDRAHKVFKKYGIDYPNVKIRYMTTRWGSCRPTKGNITLNSKLIEAPRECIDYVVFHEFAHFIHPNHSKKFYDFMTMLMPDRKERRKELNKLLWCFIGISNHWILNTFMIKLFIKSKYLTF